MYREDYISERIIINNKRYKYDEKNSLIVPDEKNIFHHSKSNVFQSRTDIRFFPNKSILYKQYPYIIVNNKNNILWAGTKEDFYQNRLISDGYYDEMSIVVRQKDYNIFDNSKKVQEPYLIEEQDIIIQTYIKEHIDILELKVDINKYFNEVVTIILKQGSKKASDIFGLSVDLLQDINI